MLKSIILAVLIFLISNPINAAESQRAKRSIDLTSCLQLDYVSCGLSLGVAYFSLHRWNDVTTTQLLGHTCTGSVKGGFYRWQWVYQARFVCPTLTNIIGTSENWKSQQGAVEHAVVDFMQKATAAGVISQPQIKVLSETDLKDATVPTTRARATLNKGNIQYIEA